MELKGKIINFLGDSITEGVGATVPEERYISIVERETGATCRNYGVGGTSFVEMSRSEGRVDFCHRAKQMEKDADIVVIFGGTNDFGHCEPIGEPEDRGENTFYGATHTLFRYIVENYPTAHIVVLTPLHRFGEKLFRVPGAPLAEFRRVILEVAEYYSLPIIDLWAESGLQPHVDLVKETYMSDGLHPDPSGHRIIAENIIKYLRAL